MKFHPKAHSFQKRATEFGLQKGCCYYMIDMGLGKTLISLMNQHNINEPVLVVAPLRVAYSTWPTEIEKWFPDKTYEVLHGPEKDWRITKVPTADFYIMNPEGTLWLERIGSRFKFPFKHLVIDEGSMWKSHGTKRFKAMRRLLSKFKYRYILSGTPSPQGLMDLWSQYYLLDGGERLGRSIGKFRDRYFNAHLVNGMFWAYTPKKGAFEVIMQKVEDITFRLSAEDYLELPELLNNEIRLMFPLELQKQYNKFEKEFLYEHEGIEVEAFNTASLSSKLRQFVQGALYTGEGNPRPFEVVHELKLNALKSLVEETNQPILCAIQFRFEIEMISAAFQKSLGSIPYIGGGISAKRGAEIIEKWNRREIPLLLCHPASLSHGANLQTGGNIILWYSLPWSLEHYLQLIKRLHRQGQERTVIVHHLIMEGTIDEQVAKALQRKDRVQTAVLEYFRGKYA